MRRTIGIMITERIAAASVEDGRMTSAIRVFPEGELRPDYLLELPAEEIVQQLHRLIELTRQGQESCAVGIGLPGMVKGGVIEEATALPQIKGQSLGVALEFLLSQSGPSIPVHVLNDADAMAAGLAATYGNLDQRIRVWTLGNGIGYGEYPQGESAGEGGHIVVTLDTKENFCSCGGRGHLEGIMGHRAMRLRFLDLDR